MAASWVLALAIFRELIKLSFSGWQQLLFPLYGYLYYYVLSSEVIHTNQAELVKGRFS